TAPAALRRQVFGFLPYWELSGASTKLNFDVRSTIAYFSVGADGNGNLRKKDADGTSTTGWGGWTSSSMTSVINAAHNRGTRVVLTISVFAWSTATASVQKSILGSATARLNLARQAAAAVRDRGADGINLDFEPIVSGYDAQFLALIRTFRSQLDAIKPGYQLTYDTTGYIGNYPIEESVATGAADAIFVMGYDYRTGSASTAGSTDPLTGTGYDLTDTVRAYTARVPASKVVLGLPWYGRAWSTVSEGVRSSNQSGLKYGYSTAVNYENVVGLVAQYGRRWDAAEQSPYVAYRRQNCTTTYGCVTSWRQLYYDDAVSTRLRLAMVNDYGLRGAGIWALGDDGGHPELYRAFAESFLVDKSAPQAGINWINTAAEPDEGFSVGWTATDTSGVAGYDVQVSVDGGAWTDWLAGTRATSDIYLGSDGHGYAFRVRARDARGNTGTWNVGQTWSATPQIKSGAFAVIAKDGLAYRTGPSTGAGQLGTLARNTIVALTRGPIAADGYSWYEVTQPIHEWSPVGFVERGVWIATASDAGSTYVNPYRAPNSTTVRAGIRSLAFIGGSSQPVSVGGATDPRSISPDGDGSGDHLQLGWTNAVAMDTLELDVFRTDGTKVGIVAVTATAAGAHTWAWDGKVGGARVADGRYVLQLVGTAAGKTYSAPSAQPVTPAQVAAYAVTVDTLAPAATSATAPAAWLSPNADGIAEMVKTILKATGATRWAVVVAGADGTAVRTVQGAGGTATLAWTGLDDAGALVPDGRYTVTASAWDAAGNHVGRSWAVTVDTAAPDVTPSVSVPAFSPDGDGTQDSATLAVTGSERVSGTARIYRGTTLVRSWTVPAGTTWSAAWNGRTTSGAAIADGTCVFRVDLRDAAGNRRVASTSIVVNRTAGFLRWTGGFFPQDKDPLLPTATVSFHLARSATTTLRIVDAAGTVVRTVWTDRLGAAGTRSWTWDGRLADGTFVPQGTYTARLTATSALGTQELARRIVASAFVVTPSATVVKAGDTLVIAFTTVEALSVRPVVTFSQPGLAPVTVTATRLAPGSYRVAFKVAAGVAGAAAVRIIARDSAGRVNAMSIAVSVAG
ncbi:MAG: glycosyl hydrolase family 18 protein, partial [Chloroflexota bacterium]